MQKLIKKLEVLVKKYFQYYIHNYIGNKHTHTHTNNNKNIFLLE